MTDPNIILVAGISGVGKTTLCRRLAMTAPAIHHLIASSFVEPGTPVDQMALVGRIRAAAADLDGACLVDGHLIVGESRIPLEAVSALAPRAILVVTGSPAEIVARRAADTTRSRAPVTEEGLRRIQEAETGYARELSATLGVPYVTAESHDAEGVRSLVYQMLEAG